MFVAVTEDLLCPFKYKYDHPFMPLKALIYHFTSVLSTSFPHCTATPLLYRAEFNVPTKTKFS